MIIFFLIVFTVYFLANGYLYYKGYNVIEAGRSRLIYTLLFVLVVSFFMAGKMLERSHSGVLSDILNVAGGFWLGYMLYAILLFMVTDLFLFIADRTSLLAGFEKYDLLRWRFIGVNAVTVIIMVAGFINAVNPVIKRYEIDIDKEVPGKSELTIAAVSDIHLGSTIRKRSMRKLQKMIELTEPDLVLFLGDILDGEIGPVLRGDLLSNFDCPHCDEGVYGVSGNHEYIGGIEIAREYITQHGIDLLEDRVVELPSGVTLIGRKDNDSFRYTGNRRQTLDRLLQDVDKTRPLILLDHQPIEPGKAAEHGIDLMLSGHTHNGQIWPISILVKSIYEIAYGHHVIGSTNIIVSSGYGLWGPRLRIGSRAEVVELVLRFRGGE